MASGFSSTGGVTPCFPYFQDVVACYILNTTKESDAGKIKCIGYRDDYYECLHHTKEKAKVRKIAEAIKRYELGLGNVKDESSMAELGLLRNTAIIAAAEEAQAKAKAEAAKKK